MKDWDWIQFRDTQIFVIYNLQDICISNLLFFVIFQKLFTRFKTRSTFISFLQLVENNGNAGKRAFKYSELAKQASNFKASFLERNPSNIV